MRNALGALAAATLLTGLMLAAGASAETLEENSFAELGIEETSLEGPGKDCAAIQFTAGEEAFEEGSFTIISIRAAPEPETGFILKAKLNGEEIGEIDGEKEKWGRLMAPEGTVQEENLLELCGATVQEASIGIGQDSTIGHYKTPVFKLEKTTGEKRPLVGKEVKVALRATNTGSEEAEASIEYRDKELEIAQITRGDSEFQGTIKPGETVELSYFVKPKFPVQMDLLPSTITYTSVFGEEETVESNRPTLFVREPEFKVAPSLAIESQELKPKETGKATISVRNTGDEKISGIELEVRAPGQITAGPSEFPKFSLEKGEAKKFEFAFTSIGETTAEIGCRVFYSDYSIVEQECAPITVRFENPKPSQYIIAGAFLIAIAITAYLYIYHPEKFKRKKKEKKE